MSASLLDERHIAVNPSLIETVGLVKAVLIQEIHFASREEYVGGEIGQVTMGQAELADRIGLGRDQVHRALKDLLRDEIVWIESEGPRTKKSYRVNVERVEELCAPARKARTARQRTRGRQTNARQRASSPTGDARQRASSMRANAQDDANMPPYREEGVEEDPPSPPDGGDGYEPDGEPSLFDDEPAPKARRRSRRQRHQPCPRFDAWWEQWPNKADRKQSHAKWARLMVDGVDPDRLDVALLNYLAAIQAHTAATGLAPSILHGATFLNGRWERYETDPTPDPAWPRGTGSGQAAQVTDAERDLARALGRVEVTTA